MNSNFQLKNAGGFDRWRRAITEKAALLLTEDLLETENDEVEDPYSNIRSHLPSDNATTQEIALWEARERQFILIHNRTQQLLEYMVQLIEPTLYERVVTTNYLKRRTPTMLYRAVKKTLGPSSKSAETELHVRIDKLENSTKTSDIDIWLNSWIQVESIAKSNRYSWANEIIDRFHAAISHRSIFFATTFAAHIWMGSITLCELAEQYRLCEAKLKRFDHIGSQDLDNIFKPPVSFAIHSKTPDNQEKSPSSENKKEFSKCVCGNRFHKTHKCFIFNTEKRPDNWKDRRPLSVRKKMFYQLQNIEIRKKIEKELGHKIPSDLLKQPTDAEEEANYCSNMNLDDNFVRDFGIPSDTSLESSYMLTLTTSQTALPYKNWWVFDSGSGRHICNDINLFWTYRQVKTHQMIATGAGNCLVEGVGSVVLNVTTPKGPGTLKVNGVLYVPGFMVNIVSMDRIKDQMLLWDHSENWLTRWDATRSPVVKIWNQFNQNFISRDAKMPNKLVLISDIPESISQDLIAQNSSYVTKHSTLKKISSADVVIWHRRFGHPATNTVKNLKNAVTGAQITGSFDGKCEGCLLSKSKRIVSRIPVDKGKNYWARMHVDLIIFSRAWNGDKYAIHAYDAKGHGHLIETLSSKDQITLMQSVINMIRQIRGDGHNVQYFHGDNEKGFATRFQEMLKSEGIIFEPTVTYTPEQNGFAESSGNRVCVVARALRIQSGLPEDLWPELVRTAVYLLNRTPTKGLEWETPYEKYKGHKPDVSNLKIIGCRAFVHIPKQKRLASMKLAERAWIGYLLGYEAHNIWRIWHPESRQVVRVRDVVFQEDCLFKDDKYNPEVPISIDKFTNMPGLSDEDILKPRLTRYINDSDELNVDSKIIRNSSSKLLDEERPNKLSPQEDIFKIPGQFSKPIKKIHNQAPRGNEISADLDESNIIVGKRNRRQTKNSSAAIFVEKQENNEISSGSPFFSCLANAFTTDKLAGKLDRIEENDTCNIYNNRYNHETSDNDPTSWKQMQKHHYKKEFTIAAQEEFQGLQARNAWEVIDINDVPEGLQIFPMRWVFVAKKDSDGGIIKFKARIVVRGDLDKTPYNRDEIYSHTLGLQHFRSLMSLINYRNLETLSFDAIQAFINAKRDRPIYCYLPDGYQQRGKVLRVQQALYGHRQSPKDWFECSGIILFFYVDDSIMAFPKEHKDLALSIQEKLCQRFPIKKLGEANSFLGLNILRDREKRKMWIVQNGYIDRIAKSYNLTPSERIMSPLAPDYDMSPNIGEKLNANQIQNFQRKVGSAIYAAICTRPDIALAVSMCADHLVNPAIRHINAITHILQYLVNTSQHGILYDCSLIEDKYLHRDVLFMASDASFANNEGRKSSQGFIAFLYGGPIVWHANKQRSVTTSTTEAELVALSAAARELMALERFLTYVTNDHNIKMTLLCDNMQTVKLLTKKTPLLTTKLRHIDIHQHWLREKLQSVNSNKLKLIWVPTSKMPADGLTKRLHIIKHQEFLRIIGIVDTSNGASK